VGLIAEIIVGVTVGLILSGIGLILIIYALSS